MQGVGEGMTNAEIAAVMRVQVRAIDTWKRRIRIKLGARNNLHAAGMWIRGELQKPQQVREMAGSIVRMATKLALDMVKRRGA